MIRRISIVLMLGLAMQATAMNQPLRQAENTPLAYAIKNGQRQVVQALLKAGAQVCTSDLITLAYDQQQYQILADLAHWCCCAGKSFTNQPFRPVGNLLTSASEQDRYGNLTGAGMPAAGHGARIVLAQERMRTLPRTGGNYPQAGHGIGLMGLSTTGGALSRAGGSLASGQPYTASRYQATAEQLTKGVIENAINGNIQALSDWLTTHSINSTDAAGNTLLHHIARYPQVRAVQEVARFLINQGADNQARNNAGQTAGNIARLVGAPQAIIEVLEVRMPARAAMAKQALTQPQALAQEQQEQDYGVPAIGQEQAQPMEVYFTPAEQQAQPYWQRSAQPEALKIQQ